MRFGRLTRLFSAGGYLPNKVTLQDKKKFYLKRFSELSSAKGRRSHGAFVVTGRRAVQGLVEAGWKPSMLVLRESEDNPKPSPAEKLEEFPFFTVNHKVMERICPLKDIIGEFLIPDPPANPPIATRGGLVLCGISDPGNLGSLFRSAAAFGFDQVVMVGAGADPYNPAVVQATAGSLPRKLWKVTKAQDIWDMMDPTVTVALAGRGGGEVGLVKTRLDGKWPWIIVGSEAHGLPESIYNRAEHVLSIRVMKHMDSLNVNAAAAIAMHSLASRNPRALEQRGQQLKSIITHEPRGETETATESSAMNGPTEA